MIEETNALPASFFDTQPRRIAPRAPVMQGAKAMLKPSRIITHLFTLIVVLVASVALALNPIGIDCSGMPFDDGEEDGVLQPVEEVGVDLAIEGGLVLVFVAEDEGTLGNAVVPWYDPEALPEDALERVVARRFLRDVCIAEEVAQGLTVVIDDAARADVEATTLARLAEIGCTVGDAFVEHGFGLTCAGENLRVVFSSRGTGTQIYLGF